MEIVYILVALLALLGGYFLFFKKSEPALPSPEKKPALKPKSEQRRKPEAAAEEDEDEAEPDQPSLVRHHRELAAGRGEAALLEMHVGSSLHVRAGGETPEPAWA